MGLTGQFIDEKASTRAGHDGVVVAIDGGEACFDGGREVGGCGGGGRFSG